MPQLLSLQENQEFFQKSIYAFRLSVAAFCSDNHLFNVHLVAHAKNCIPLAKFARPEICS